MESDRIYAKAIIVSDYSEAYSHWNAKESLADWLKREQVPGVTGIDTRALTKVLREHGVMMGHLEFEGLEGQDLLEDEDYASINWVERVSCKDVIRYNEGAGVKNNIIRCLIQRGVEVIRVPWNYDYTEMDFDGLFLANGPGDPDRCVAAVEILQKQMSRSRKPICGICMGNQLLAKAGGATIYKLKYGHRSHNQPVREVGTNRCYVTSQNHGYAVDASTLGNDWRELFVNMNDGSNEGIRHLSHPWFSSQFHPEACSGPVDTEFMFDRFIETL
jgi:carbamoyl-phosphate synthase small subunit